MWRNLQNERYLKDIMSTRTSACLLLEPNYEANTGRPEKSSLNPFHLDIKFPRDAVIGLYYHDLSPSELHSESSRHANYFLKCAYIHPRPNVSSYSGLHISALIEGITFILTSIAHFQDEESAYLSTRNLSSFDAGKYFYIRDSDWSELGDLHIMELVGAQGRFLSFYQLNNFNEICWK